MQHEGRGKAAKVDENVSQWTKICRSTVSISHEIYQSKVLKTLQDQVRRFDKRCKAKIDDQ